ncbi:peptide chain release factor 2 [Candidatus Microgenomates bacterium]|jgi:peptide chain release factor 2|nr:MAG: peptide chain release factor 2 [Candidatus Microgenomates bacterium]
MEEIVQKIEELKKRLEFLVAKLNVEDKRKEIKSLEAEAARPGFWDDPGQAQAKTKLLSLYNEELSKVQEYEEKINSLKELASSEDASELQEDLKKEVDSLEKAMEKLEISTYLSGPYDRSSAIVSIHAGQGGTEAMDWAQMLERMYVRFAEKRSWKVDVVDEIAGDEAGIKSATLSVEGPFAYGYLKGERGAHRLVRQSPFNADKLRQTSFALVEVLPEIEEAEKIPIPDSDIEWDFFRASSHGGQNVQKVSTAVRLRHLPTGIVVTSQSERYQERNREIALNLLRSKLWQLEEEKKERERKDLKGEFKLAAWGNQIRSYVLHPYKMVKDLRTEYEVNDPFSVLDGNLDGFIEAELKTLKD